MKNSFLYAPVNNSEMHSNAEIACVHFMALSRKQSKGCYGLMNIQK